jgi:hypothetical protein
MFFRITGFSVPKNVFLAAADQIVSLLGEDNNDDNKP